MDNHQERELRAEFEAAVRGWNWSLQKKVDCEGDTVYVDDLTQGGFVGYCLARRSSPSTQRQGEGWGPISTVGDMVRNLMTLDQAAPIHAAFHMSVSGERKCRTYPLVISRERVIDGKWIDSSRKDVPYEHVVWAKPDGRAHPGDAPEGS